MNFDPSNNIVKLCLQGQDMEAKGQPAEASQTFMQAWNEARNDFEKFLAAHFVARHQPDLHTKLHWLHTALQYALAVNNEAVASAFHGLYQRIAQCYQDLGDPDNAQKNHELATQSMGQIADKGPFYHGTRAQLQVGDLLTPGGMSNYHATLKMNHIYFTAMVNGAGLAAAMAKGDAPERVYIIEPTGPYENDPNVTDKKFPGNPTRSYRSTAPLRITGETNDWTRLTPEQLQKWRDRLAGSRGEIIN